MNAHSSKNRPLYWIGLIVFLATLLVISASSVFSSGGPVLISAVFYDGYLISGNTESEEGLQIMNVSAAAVDISGWAVTDNEGTVSFPSSTSIAAGERIWLAYNASTFRDLFGFTPDFEYGTNSDATVPNMSGSAPKFSNNGDQVVLLDDTGTVMDAMVYENGQTNQTGWSGAAVQPADVFPMDDPEQVLFRKLDETSGFPITDTDTASDWATDKTAGAVLYGPVEEGDLFGKKVMAPGWDLGIYGGENTSATDHWVPVNVSEAANTSILVAPDNIYDGYISAINSAQNSIDIESYTFKHREIAEAIAAQATAGVTVRVLLEGGPCCDGVPDQETLWVAQTIENAGGNVYFMHDDGSSSGGHDRYNFQHAKFTIVDGSTLLTGSENLNCGSMPNDNKANGTSGNRGTYLKTDAPTIVGHFADIFSLDLDTTNHKDIVSYGFSNDYTWDGSTVPALCANSDGSSYPIQKPSPLAINGTLNFEVVQVPENALRYSDSLIGMVLRAGAGDVVLVEQAYERKFWGDSTSNANDDPNPRLEAYIEAARNGASVRIILDAEFDDPAGARDNTATVAYVNGIASSESLDLEARLVDCSGCVGPAGSGIHNKMVMVHDTSASTAWVHIGSINGSENSSKFNREMAVQVESLDAFCYLYDIINYDWQYSGGSDLGLGCGGPMPTPTPTATATLGPTPTPTTTPSGTTMHVEVIDFDTSVNHGRFLTYDVTGLVTILDNSGNPVANADVDVQWSGAFSGTETIQTDANGVASTSTITIDNNETVCLAVTDVQHPSFTYDSNQNIENQDCITV